MIPSEQAPVAVVLALSITAQVAAAAMAMRLIPVTGRRLAWSLIAAALTLMAVRRVVPLVRLLAGDQAIAPDPLNEVIGLALSVLMAGGIARIAPIFRERMRVEELLQEREQRVTRLLAESPLALVVSAGANEEVQLVNRRFTELFGYTIADIPDVAHWWPLAYPDPAYRESIRAQWSEKIARARRSRETVEPMEATVTCKDGSRRDIEFHLSSLGERHLVTFIDLTARKQAERRIHESEERLRLTMEATRIGVWDWDVSRDRWYASPTFYTMLGYAPENGLADRNVWLERVHPEDRALVAEKIRDVVERGFSEYRYEARMRHADGGYRWIDVRGFGIERDAAGKVTRLLGTRTDISDHKHIEAALRESEEKFRLLHENAGVGIGYYTPTGTVISFNRLAASHMGGKPEDFTGKAIHQLFPQAEADLYLERLQRAIAANVPFEYEDRVSLPTGIKWFLSVFVRICNAQGDVAGVQIISKDVTERHLAAQELQRSNDLLRAIIEATPTAIIGLDLDGNVQHVWNPAAEKLLGWSAAEIMGRPLPTVPAENQEEFRRFREMIRQGLTLDGMEVCRQKRDGSPLHYSIYASPLHDAEGRITGNVAVLVDISERLKTEAELRRHREHLEELVAERTAELEAANRELESFSYSVSHDLRTPLRAIDGFSHLLATRYAAALDTEANRLIRVVRHNSAKMSRLIDDILAFSRTGRTEMRNLPVDMGRLAREAWTDLEPLRTGREICFELEPLAPTRGDPAMLRQLWVNLLGNAVKFTRHTDGARIRVWGKRSDSEYTYYVQDNGVGFDQAYAHKLFGVFQRLHGVQEFEGTGIGLAIVKRIIARHGGRIEAEGAVGQGATFRFTLPVMETDI